MLFGILLIGMRLIDVFLRFRQYLRQILSFLGFYGKLVKEMNMKQSLKFYLQSRGEQWQS